MYASYHCIDSTSYNCFAAADTHMKKYFVPGQESDIDIKVYDSSKICFSRNNMDKDQQLQKTKN